MISNASMVANYTEEETCFVQDTAIVQTARVSAYSLIFVISALGNSMSIAVVKLNRAMRKPFNYFIVNMAAADLTITLVYVPRVMVMLLVGSQWLVGGVFGSVLCKVVPFLHGTSILASILTLLTISVDRFAAVVFPLRRKLFSLKSSRFVIALIWILSTAVRFPYLYSLNMHEHENKLGCSANIKAAFENVKARDIYYTFLLVTFYLLPFTMIIASYSAIIVVLRKYKAPCNNKMARLVQESRGKASRKILYMMLTVTVTFVCCWLTYFLAQILFQRVPCSLRFWRLFLAHSNSALNPCFYAVFNKSFREGYRRLLCWFCQRFGQDESILGPRTTGTKRQNSFHNKIIKTAAQYQRGGSTSRKTKLNEKLHDLTIYETNV